MREALAELIRVLCRFRTGVPWASNRVAYRYMPFMAVALAWGMSIGVAGSLWYVSPIFQFNPWALLFLVVPAASGFYLTYLFDLLDIGLGWRTIEVVLQVALSVGLFIPASTSGYGVAAGLIATACAWAVGVRCGSDLVVFRPDQLKPGHLSDEGMLSHPGLEKLVRSLLLLFVISALGTGFIARWQQAPASWWTVVTVGIGALAAAVAGLTLMGWAREAVERSTWEANDVLVQPHVYSVWRYWAWRIAMGAGLLGFLLPANLSPLGGLSYNALFQGFNGIVAPFFVRTGSRQSSKTSDWGAQAVERLSGWESLPGLFLVQAIFYAALIMGCIWILWRIWPYMRVGEQERPLQFGKERGILRWLWETILGWFRRATGVLFSDTSTSAEHGRASSPVGHRKSKRRVWPTEPQALVRFLYARYLEAAAAKGVARQSGETASEYRQRLAPRLSTGSDALADLTGMYERVRYGLDQADESLASRFKRVWATARRALRHLTT